MNHVILMVGYPPQIDDRWISSLKDTVNSRPVTVLDFNHSLKRHIHTVAKFGGETIPTYEYAHIEASRHVISNLSTMQKMSMMIELALQIEHRDNQVILVVNIPEGLLCKLPGENCKFMYNNKIILFKNPRGGFLKLFKNSEERLYTAMHNNGHIKYATYINNPQWNLFEVGDWKRILTTYGWENIISEKTGDKLMFSTTPTKVKRAGSSVLLKSLKTLHK